MMLSMGLKPRSSTSSTVVIRNAVEFVTAKGGGGGVGSENIHDFTLDV